MAGPRAPIGTLSQHAETAAKLAKKKGYISSTAKNVVPKKQPKYDPRAHDSDSSDSESDSSSDSDSFVARVPMADLLAKLKADKNKKANGVPPVSKDSSGSDSGSSSESSSDESDSKSKKINMANKKTNKKARATTTSDSGSNSESDSSSDSDTSFRVNVASPTKKSTPKSKARVDSESDIVPDSVEKNSASKTSPDLALAKAKTPETIVISSDNSGDEHGRPSKAVAKQNGISGNVREFVGRNFKLRKMEDRDTAEVARIFRDAKTEGKQVWYFTVPSSLPIEVMQEQIIPLNQLNPGSTILTQGQFDFTANHDGPVKTAITVMMPERSASKYKTLNSAVDSMLVKKVMHFNTDDSDEQSFNSVASKTPRAQPPGLKARYQPLGVPPVYDSDIEMIAPQPLTNSNTPKTETKKRKLGVNEGSASPAANKSKKARLDATAVSASTSKQNSNGVAASNLLSKQPASSPIVSRSVAAASSSLVSSTQPSGSKAKSFTIPAKVTPVPLPSVPGMRP